MRWLERCSATGLGSGITAVVMLAAVGLLLSCGGPAPSSEAGAGASPDSAAESAAPAPPQPRVFLSDGSAVSPGTTALDQLQRVDLLQAQSNGNLSIEGNDPAFLPRVPAIIDGNVASLVRSEGVNPLVLTLTFREPIRLAAARVYPAGSPYDWLVEPTPGGERPMIENAADSTWSQLDLSEPVTTTVVRLEILRRERDDYVHVCEIELYTKP